jgi:hypothetical protein
MFEFKLSFFAFLAILSSPSIGLARTYDALCSDNQNCKVEISYERLIVGGRIVPIRSIASWSKSGPGTRVNPNSGPILSILLGAPFSQLVATEYKEVYALTYYTDKQKKDSVFIGFVNKRYSRWFETELQATTGLPQGDINDQAPLFNWNSIEYSSPSPSTLKKP